MSVSRRLRFEVLRRDAHTCRYCGDSAPDVKLTVDHVLPVALGGTDEPGNLVTACQPCNAGKSSIAPDAAIVANVSDDAIRWANALKLAAERTAEQRGMAEAFVDAVDHTWSKWKSEGEQIPRPGDWRLSLARFYHLGLPLDAADDAVQGAMMCPTVKTENTWKYFCGICWKMVEEQQEIARDLIEQGSV